MPDPPGKRQARVGFYTALISLGVLVNTAGISGPLSFIGSLVAIFVSREGIRRLEDNPQSEYAGKAKWGFWIGVIGLVLAALASGFWIWLITLA